MQQISQLADNSYFFDVKNPSKKYFYRLITPPYEHTKYATDSVSLDESVFDNVNQAENIKLHFSGYKLNKFFDIFLIFI